MESLWHEWPTTFHLRCREQQSCIQPQWHCLKSQVLFKEVISHDSLAHATSPQDYMAHSKRNVGTLSGPHSNILMMRMTNAFYRLRLQWWSSARPGMC